MATGRVVGRVLAVLAGASLGLFLSPSAAFACSVSYREGDSTGGCGGTAPVVGAVVVGAAAVTVAAALAVLNYLRGRMAPEELDAYLAAVAGSTPATAADRELAALMARHAQLGDTPPTLNVERNDRDHGAVGAHTVERHGPGLPLRRGTPGVRTVEGRIYGDPPWARPENWSYRWLDPSTMNRVINEYVAANWERIRSELALRGRFRAAFDAGRAVGDGYFNAGMYGAGPRAARYSVTSYVDLRMELVPGVEPPQLYLVSAFPSGLP